ncbi:uncharacterized protein TA07880 [Theileria annulata]|uniref:Uncharacterized protein n=1 Tax=Theileria annulata TaxID=5874 RepID=Q4U9X8_THEAN|nr:uncharacterized protein TA07880 [Theileria annulata]CAI76375.1 hypothetical protein TA07880 [Theileria annulata]|eukprot:XP_953000.1 hypothetical protein TA07880 [Theileria annulata]
MCFKREEITSHELFPYFRLDVLSNSSMFGAVYSRFLNNLLKSSKVFKSTRLKNGLKHYSFYRDKVSNEYLSLDNYVDVFFPVLMDQKSFFQRVLNLCKNNDKLDVIESIFKDHREPKMSLIRELFSVRCTFIRSHWGYLVSRVTKMNTKSTLELISQICEPKDIKNFDYLKTGEDNLQFAEAHQETIMNLFSHVYKIYRRAKEEVYAKRSLDPLGNLGIVILESRPTEDELAAIYFLCKYHLSNRFEDILCHFIQIVDYINRRIQTKECDYKSMKMFIETVCIIYMKYIVKRCFRFDRRLRLIIKEIVTGREKINMAISSNAREDLANKGLENFLKFLNIECEDPKSQDLIYGIIRDSDSIFIYDFKKERFVCGNNVEEMDLRNFEGKCLDKVNSCHFIIFSNSFDGEKTVKENIEFIEKNYLGKIKHELLQTFITLDLPNFKQNPPQPFDECVLRQGKIVTHPIKQLELENNLLKNENENLSKELLGHSDLLKDYFTLKVYSQDKELECSNLKNRVESLEKEIYNRNEVVKKLESQLKSKQNFQNLNLTSVVTSNKPSNLPERSLTSPICLSTSDKTSGSGFLTVNNDQLSEPHLFLSKLRSEVHGLKSENLALKDMLNRTGKVYRKEFERLNSELEWAKKSNEQLQKYCYLLSSLDSQVSQSEVSDEIERIIKINH